MQVLSKGQKEDDQFKIEFVFSTGCLNNLAGDIPRNELSALARGVTNMEKVLDYMVPRVKNKALISDARVLLYWIRNKQNIPKPICRTECTMSVRISKTQKFISLRGRDNPADLGTKYARFKGSYKNLGEESLLRNGHECL